MFVELTVLGCWAPYPRAGGACSGYLVRAGGKNILIECGNGVLSNLQKHIDFRLLDAVIISHLHPDHCMDLHCLRHAVGGARRTDPELGPLPLYLPKAPRETFNVFSGFTEAFVPNPIEDLIPESQEGAEVYRTAMKGVNLEFIRTDHPLPCFAVAVEAAGEGRLFFSGDTRWCDYLPELARGPDILLCEASVIEADREYANVGHLTARQAGELARQARAARLIITHFWPEYDLETLRAEAESGFGGPVTVAVEGMKATKIH